MSKRIILTLVALALAACSGGGGSSPLPSSQSSRTGTGTLSFTLRVPAKKASSARVRTAYVSPNTASVAIQAYTPTYTKVGAPAIINVSGCPVSSGSATCTSTLQLPGGPPGSPNQYILIAYAYSGINGTGSVLSDDDITGFGSNPGVAAAVAIGSNTNVVLTLGGDPATITFAQQTILAAGVPGSTNISFAAFDASGNQIVGADPFGQQLLGYMTLTSTTGTTSPFSLTATVSGAPPSVGAVTTLSSPTTPVLAADGTKTVNSGSFDGYSVTFTLGQSSSSGNQGTFTPLVDRGLTATPTSLVFASTSSPAQTLTLNTPEAMNLALNGCGSATATQAGSSVMVTPAADTPAACELVIQDRIESITGWVPSVVVPISVGAPQPNTDVTTSTSDITFASASSPSQTLTVTPPSTYSGPVSIQSIACYSNIVTITPATPANWTNQVSYLGASSPTPIVSFSPATSASVNGSPVAFTFSPIAPGSCIFNVSQPFDTYGPLGFEVNVLP